MIIEELANTLRFSIGRNKLKYENLNDMIQLHKVDCLHINLTGIFNHLIAKYFAKTDVIDDSYKYVIASSVINIAAHYRHYFTKKNMYPAIYIYCGHTGFEAIDKALALVRIICQYIPRIYYIDEDIYGADSDAFIRYFVKEAKNASHLILTKDIKDIQLVKDKCHMIMLNKDNSKYYYPDNMYNQLLEKDLDFKLDRHLIGPLLFFSGIGCKKKGIKGMGGVTTAKLFKHAVDAGHLANTRYNNANDFIEDIKHYAGDKYDYLPFANNFNKYEVHKRYNEIMTDSMVQTMNDYIIDRFSKTDLVELNNKYFTGHDSLQFDFLLEEPISKRGEFYDQGRIY